MKPFCNIDTVRLLEWSLVCAEVDERGLRLAEVLAAKAYAAPAQEAEALLSEAASISPLPRPRSHPAARRDAVIRQWPQQCPRPVETMRGHWH